MAVPLRKLEDFQCIEFWDHFFETLESKPFEWYCDYEALKPFILQRCKEQSVLIPGCGNSDLSARLYDDGVMEIMNIDFSKLVIREMLTKNLRQRPKMKWQVMDVAKMKFTDCSFDVVLDKGTLDALMSDAAAESDDLAHQYLKEVMRVMKPSSVYFCVSLLQSHILDKLLRFFRHGFQSSVHELVLTAEKQVSEMRTFLFVAEKHEHQEGLSEVLLETTLAPSPEESLQIKDIRKVVASENEARKEQGKIPVSLHHGQDFDVLHPGRRVVLESLRCPYSACLKQKLKFNAIILDNQESFDCVCSVFIIPRGRAKDWLYASVEGQWSVSQQCQANRVILVELQDHKEHYTMDGIQEALSPGVIPYIPRTVRFLPKATPYLTSQAAPSEIFCDRALYESKLTGKLIVRDCLKDDQILRRLYFSTNEDLIQSEIRLLHPKGTPPSQALPDVGCLEHDVDFLSSSYQRVIVSGLQSLQEHCQEDGTPSTVMIVGLGGGVLPVYLHKHFPWDVSVVELDPATQEVAQDWFGLDPSIPVHIADGVQFIHDHTKQGNTMDVLVIDAGGKEAQSGISCPPPAFLSVDFLKDSKACLREGGMLVVNLVSRSIDACQAALQTLQSIYPFVYCFCIKEDANRVVFAADQDLQFIHNLQVKCERDWKENDIIKGLEELMIKVGEIPNNQHHHHYL